MSRVTQQYVDCLFQTAAGPVVYVVSALDTLALTQVAHPVSTLVASAAVHLRPWCRSRRCSWYPARPATP